MKILITGGSGFIGRHVTKQLLEENHIVYLLDNLSNSTLSNIIEFHKHPSLALLVGKHHDITSKPHLHKDFMREIDICIHLAANINVQDSIDNPAHSISDITGTFNLLEECRKHNTKFIYVSTCMVYAPQSIPITENHPTKPSSPYAASKLSCENLALSYYNAYNLPVIVLRPFNTYGPFQKSNSEGGVVSIFIQNTLKNQPLKIYGSGNQTRDLLYVTDCADFIIKASLSNHYGEIINAGTGYDISINCLAHKISSNIEHIDHIHPQSEISKLCCNPTKAKKLLNWEPKISLNEGIKRVRKWIERSD